MKRILVAAALAAATLPAAAQSSEVRQALTGLMSMDCGVGETADRFRTTLQQNREAAGPILLELLAEGAPRAVREQARADAEARYDQLTEWARRNPEKPHAQTMANLSRDSYVSEKIDRLDLTYRSNALRGLAVVQPADAAPAIRRSFESDPRLKELGERALRALGGQ